MRKRLLPTTFLVLLAFAFGSVQAGSGGPDLFGYTWIDSDEAGHSFNWVEISNNPNAVQVAGLADDNSVGPFNIGFDFRYYWTDYNSVKVGSNGWLSFDNVGNIASCFPTIPTQGGAGDNILAPFMSDVTFSSSFPNQPNIGEMYYWTNNVDTFILQVNNAPWWQQGTPDWVGSNTYQVILSGVDSSITFNYLDTDQANFSASGACPTAMEVGIENLTGNIGLQVFTGNTTIPGDNFSIKFDYPGTITFQVPDATPAWAANSENAGQFYFINTPIDMQANIANVGNAAITSAITVDGNLQSLAFQTIWSDQTSIANGLAAGTDQTVTFPNQANLATSGQYYYNVASANGQDINQTNDNNQVEISAVEAVGGKYNLTYATLNPPDGAISWAGGGVDDGVAVKYVPPSYPYTIDSVRLFILGDDGDPNTPMLVGYTLNIYDTEGGTALQTITQNPADITEDDWNTVALSTPYVVNSGDVYVSWLQGGTGVALGTEAFGPISRRSYEILGGAWAPYRQNTVQEMLIEVIGSGVVSVEDPNSLSNTLVAYPNPVADLLNVDYEVPALSDVNFQLTNSIGQVVWRKTHTQIPTGKYQFNIEVNNLTSGMYFLNMEQNGERVVKKVMVK